MHNRNVNLHHVTKQSTQITHLRRMVSSAKVPTFTSSFPSPKISNVQDL